MRILVLSFLLLLASGSMSRLPPPVLVGIQTSLDYTVEELVRDIFLKGECRNVDNIQAIGNPLSVGYFEGGNNIFGFSRGVILSSGDIKLAEGPNSSVEASATFGDNSSDPDISLFATNAAFDVAGIEFDFIPIGETVTFRYVFASEEYCEFVGSIFNDVFGFFVSGPGINGPFADGAINVALLPGTNEYVAINSVNHNDNSSSYLGNELKEDADKCGIPFNPSYLEFIEYDGMTIPLTATINVIPCETYRIRLLVADVGDDKLDSGVFLETKSFDLGGDVTVRAEVQGSEDPVAVENCRNGRFIFTRSATQLDEERVVHFTISASSTAENGVDFIAIPDSIVIPPGEQTVTLPIAIFEDPLIEGEETLTLELSFPCDCIDPVAATLYIRDPEPVSLVNNEIEVCAGQSFTIGPSILSGTSPYTYLWENGTTGSTITTSVSEITHFTVTVTDACGTTAPGIVAAIIQPVPEAVISGEISVCEGQERFLEISFQGNPPWSFQYSIDGGPPRPVSGITQNPYKLPVDEPGTFELVNFREAFCTGTVSGQGRVLNAGGNISYSVTPPTCPGIADAVIDWDITGGSPPYQIQWTPAVNNDLNPTGLVPGTYILQVTDGEGCIVTEEILVLPNGNPNPDCSRFELYVPNVFTPNGDGINDTFRLFPEPASQIQEIVSLHIFDRWGGIVYEKRGFEPQADMPLWDGAVRNREAGPGVYVWQVVLVLKDGRTETLAGDVTLLK